MYEGYTKLFSSIITSTIWQEDIETKIVWITLLALKDKDGYVAGSIPGIANIAGVSVEKCLAAIKKLKAPDIYSRSRDYDGRRIKDVDGGWIILNAAKYRDKRDPESRKWQNREAKRRERAKNKQYNQLSAGVSENADDADFQPKSAHTDTDTDTDNESETRNSKDISTNEMKKEKILSRDFVSLSQKQKLTLKLCNLFAVKSRTANHTAICNLAAALQPDQHETILQIARNTIESPTAKNPIALFFSELKRQKLYETGAQ